MGEESAEGRRDPDAATETAAPPPVEDGSRPPAPPVFTAFSHRRAPRRFLPALAAAAVVYGLVSLAVIRWVERPTPAPVEEEQRPVDVTFVEKVVREPPPSPLPVATPAPPPPPAPKRVPPAAAAPVVRPEQKVRKVEPPPAPKPLVAPREMPAEAPEEADPSEDRGVAVVGEPGQGDPAGLEGGVGGAGVAGGSVGGAIELPTGAEPPIPSKRNRHPPYPDRARRKGLSDTVTLRVVVLADGTVSDIVVLDGDSPFVEEAVATVKTWRYEPARFKGQPIAVYRTLRIQFTLRG